MTTDIELRDLVSQVERIAIGAGPVHGAFDIIAVAELHLSGRESDFSRDHIVHVLRSYLHRDDSQVS